MSLAKRPLHLHNEKKLFIFWIVLMILWLIITIVSLAFKDNTGRLLADYYDRYVYFERGKWFPEHKTPISEYPQVPTLLFGINHLTSMWVDKELQPAVYIALFSLEMFIVLFLVLRILLKLLPSESSDYAILMLLPPVLYFVYNRFDILPAYLCLVAYHNATKKRWTIVSIVLAIATFTKWYPILLFPGFLMYASVLKAKFQWKMVLMFIVTSALILLPTYIQGGIDAVLAPYQFHFMRGMESVALPVLLDNLLQSIFDIKIGLSYFSLAFLVLQVFAPVMSIFTRMDSLDALVYYCIIVIALFVLFSRIYSPQWFLWLLPFLVISAENKVDVVLIIAYSFTTFLGYPVFFDIYDGASSIPLQLASLATYLILGVIIFRAVGNLKWKSTIPIVSAN